MRRHVAGLASLLSLLGALSAVDASAADRLSPEAILGRVAKVYAGCRSYRDTGLVHSAYVDHGRTTTEEKPFATAFERGGRFRYEFTDGATGHRFIAWRDGGDVRVRWDVKPGVERPASLDLAIAGAAGISSLSAHTLPALLLPELHGNRLTDLQSLKRLDDETLGAVLCYRIEGRQGNRPPMTVWIDRQTFLVRRIDRHQQLPKDVQVDTVTTYEPELDGKIPAEALAFGH